MRVGICLPHLRVGGVEKGLVFLLIPLRQRGIEVVLFVQSKEGDLLGDIPDGTDVIALGGVGVLRTAFNLASQLRQRPVDLLCTATNALNIAALLAARRLGATAPPVIIGEHIPVRAFLATRRFAPLRVSLMRLLYPRAAALVAPSLPLIQEHQSLLGAACPTGHVVSNPVIDRLAPMTTLAPVARNIISLGRLSPEKGFDLAINAFAQHSKRDPHAQLTLYGTGPERDALQSLAVDLGLADKIRLPGYTADVAGVMADADLFLCTSHVEGFGNAIVEAQAAGVPVLSVDCPVGPRILLQDGEAGCLVMDRDPEVVGAAITAFTSDLTARQQAVAKGRDVAAGYTKDASADAHMALFRNVLEARRANQG